MFFFGVGCGVGIWRGLRRWLVYLRDFRTRVAVRDCEERSTNLGWAESDSGGGVVVLGSRSVAGSGMGGNTSASEEAGRRRPV